MEAAVLEPVIAPVIEPKVEPAKTEAAQPVVQEPAKVEPKVEIPPTPVSEPEDPKLQKLIQAYKNGTAKEYLEKTARDYKAMSDEDMFRLDLRKQNPGASEKAIEVLLKQRLSKYDLTDFSDDEEAGNELRKLDADKLRDALQAEQAEFQLPTEAQKDPQAEKAQAEYKAELKANNDHLESHPSLKEFEMNPVLKMGEKGEFNYAVDPAVLNRKTLLYPERTIDKSLWSTDEKTGKKVFDMDMYIRLQNYRLNYKAVEAALIEHGKTLGSKAEFDERHNHQTELSVAAPAGSERKVTVRRD